jgi:hypothetical protein
MNEPKLLTGPVSFDFEEMAIGFRSSVLFSMLSRPPRRLLSSRHGSNFSSIHLSEIALYSNSDSVGYKS